MSVTFNLVLHVTKAEWVAPHEHEAAVREAGVKAAHYLAVGAMRIVPGLAIPHPVGGSVT